MAVSERQRAEELLERTQTLVPLLRASARDAEREGRVAPGCLEAIADAGVLRMTAPAEAGGYQLPVTTQVDVLAALARGCGSTSWVCAVYSVGIWLAGNFSDAIQEEVFAQPDVRITVVGAPTGRLTRDEAGAYRLSGRWGFNTGCLDAHYAIVGALREGGPSGGQEDDATLAIVPYEHLQLADDWDVSGLAGTGSRTITADDVPLTEAHLWPMAEAGTGIRRSARHRDDPYWRTIIGPFITANSAGTPLGLAQAALEHYLEGLQPPRPMTLTSYADRSQAAITHLQVGEAASAVEAAAFHAGRAATDVDEHCASGEPYAMLERARIRSDVGRVTGLARTAAHLLWQGSGASAISREHPIQRIVRDIDALAQHAVMNPDTNLELYGRVLCGLEPHTEAL
jgi:alkylation response protein AidB-like acyl-CoA dehydrogenase